MTTEEIARLRELEQRLRARKFFFLNGAHWLMGTGPDHDCTEAADAIASFISLAEARMRAGEEISSPDLDWLIDTVRADIPEPPAKVEEKMALAVLRDSSLSHASVWAAVPEEARLEVASIIEGLINDRARLLARPDSAGREWRAIDEAVASEREACALIALAIDSNRGNEKEIARAIRARGAPPNADRSGEETGR